MSLYDAVYAAYESRPITMANQIYRAQNIIRNHHINSPHVTSPNAAPITVTQNHVRVNYPQYQPGYPQGTTTITLPTAQANPAPIANQYAHTSAHTYYMFTAAGLPPLLFRIEPYKERFRIGNDDIPVPVLHDQATNRPVVTNRGATLRFFSFLPRYISHTVPGALLEFWFRLDYRLEMNDILMRIESPPGNMVRANTLNMRRNRFRHTINVQAWMDCRTFPPQHDLDVARQYSAYQICLNTCMKVDLANGRFLKPTFTNISCQPNALSGWVDAGIAGDYFLTQVVTSIPTRRMVGILALLQRTQELAIILDHGNAWDNYKYLSDDDAPPWWNDRRKGQGQADGRGIEEIDGWTWRDWMVNEVGADMEVGIARRAKTRGQNV